jgi:protein pelota
MQQVKRMEDGVRLRIQFEDDLWVLNQMIRPGCKVGMMGYRRDQSTGTEASGRAKSADRKPMWIVLDAETTEFQPFTDNLRVHGIICEAKMDKGSHHTHAVGPRDEIEISWPGEIPETDRSLLAESLQEGGRGRVAIAVVESDEILLFEIAQHGMRQVGDTFTLRGGGKRETKSAEVRKEFLVKIAEQASKAISAEMPVVICGPGMAREQFETFLKATGVGHRILNVATSIGGRSAANEIMREGAADAVLGEFAMAKQAKLIEEGLKRISTRGAVAYGQSELGRAVEQGSIETLIIEASLLRSESFWTEVATKVRANGGQVIQASSDHDAGEELMGLGGAIGLLRWVLE